MGRLIPFLSLLLLMAAPAWSGAWLREKGKAFTSAAVTAFRQQDGSYEYKSSLYAEWGFRPKLTFGLNAEEHQDLYGHALVFARLPVADFGQKGRLAAEFGIGAHHRQTRSWAMYKTTLSYGKGFQNGWGNGWIAIDAALEYRTHEALFRKLDLTAGLFSGYWLNPLLQIETTYTPNQPVYWRARPSVMFRPRGGKSTWILGAERNSVQSKTGIKLALWLEY